jgi:hypothetical protein
MSFGEKTLFEVIVITKTILILLLIANAPVFAVDLSQMKFTPVGSQEIFEGRYYFRGDSRPPEIVFCEGFEINHDKQGQAVTELFGSGPEYLSFSRSFMAAAGFPILKIEDSPYSQLEDESYVYVISKKIHAIEGSNIVDFMAESIRQKLQIEALKNYDFKDVKNNLQIIGPGLQVDMGNVAEIWGSLLRHYWPKEMVIKHGTIAQIFVMGCFKVHRIHSPLSESSNLVRIKDYVPNTQALEVIDEKILADSTIIKSKWLLNLAMYNPVHFFDGMLQFYVNMLVSEREHQKDRNVDSINVSLKMVEDHWISKFEKEDGYNLLEKNPPGIQTLLKWK